jgi:hypothetical protein
MAGKNMNYFLMDGTPNGRIKCTLANWTGVAYKIPRVKLVDCKNIDYLKQSGVYFLFSKGEGEKPLVYVGQAGSRKNGEGVLNRLKEHHANPKPGLEDWYEAIAFTTSNNIFGATEISWLENRFFALASKANRYEAKNGNEPNAGNVTEEKESELEEYVDYAKIVMGVLGHFVFEPLSAPVAPTINNEPTETAVVELEIRQNNFVACGQRTSDGFVLLKGSQVKAEMGSSLREAIKTLRVQYAESIDANGYTTTDILLKSANEAAQFVLGYPVNAMTTWKTADGKTLKEIQTSEAETL